MRKSILAGALALALSAGLSGCASLITGGELIRPGEPTGVIRIENHSSVGINAVLISDCSASTYGLNRLPAGMMIPRGGSYDFTVSAGCWDAAVGRVGYGETRDRFTVSPGRVYRFGVTG